MMVMMVEMVVRFEFMSIVSDDVSHKCCKHMTRAGGGGDEDDGGGDSELLPSVAFPESGTPFLSNLHTATKTMFLNRNL